METFFIFHGKGRPGRACAAQSEDDMVNKVRVTIAGAPYAIATTDTEIEDNTPCVVTLDAFITDGGDGYDASLFKGYEIPEFDNLGIISTDAFMDYLKGFKKPITVESTHMPVISK